MKRMRNFSWRTLLLTFLLLVIISGQAICSAAGKVRIGIAWRADTDSEFYTNIYETLEYLGAEPVLLPQVKAAGVPYRPDGSVSGKAVDKHDYLLQRYADIIKQEGWQHSNAAEAVQGVAAVIFTGGEDISPTLYAVPQPWHGILAEQDYNGARDVSDYLLMQYCLDKEIPFMGFCRGAQMLGVVSGATVIQDIPVYLAANGIIYKDQHRRVKAKPEDYRDYAPHAVTFAEGSRLRKIFGGSEIDGAPSWHHQAIMGTVGTKLKITATTTTDRLLMVEGVERTDKRWAVGLQFHPEAAVVKNLHGVKNAGDFLPLEQALLPFRALLDYAGAAVNCAG